MFNSHYSAICVFSLITFFLPLTEAHAEFESAEPTDVERQVFDYMGMGEPKVLRLWPGGSERNQSINGKPESGKLTDKLRITNLQSPSLLIYPPPAGVKKLDAAVIHCPGGGYNYLAMAQPKQFTQWMNRLGVTVAVLKYHTPRDRKNDPKHLIPLADAQRALRVLRHNAKSLGLSPDKIGIAGASAGGHLAFNTCLNHETPVYEPVDQIDQLSARPAFAMLFYPAYLAARKDSIQGHADLAWDQIDKNKTPPIFITINGDDRGFVSGNVAAMTALGNKGVSAELHIWPKGGHSGCFDKYPLAEFARPGARFLSKQGILPQELLPTSDAWLNQVVAKLRNDVEVNEVESINPPDGLKDAALSPIDQAIRKAAGKGHLVYKLWPGDGTRSDDPFKADSENLRKTNNDIAIASSVTAPTMTFFPAEKPNGKGVVVFPGGGYGVLAWDHEGVKVCEWLNSRGINAFLVKYRTPRRKGLEKHAVALQDAQRAIRLVRSQAEAFGVLPDKIGVLGFSAGGHLAALTDAQGNKPSYEAIDDLDTASAQPDFKILIYPAYTANKDNEIDPLLVQDKASSPTFIATAADDGHTRTQYPFVHLLLQTKTPVEFHVYENGGHGKGILPGDYAFSQWPRECARWLTDVDRK